MSWLSWAFLCVVAVWSLVLIVGLFYSLRRFITEPREAKLVAAACILELIYIGQMMFGDVVVLLVPVLPVAVVEILSASRSTYLLAIHPVSWGLVLLAVFGRKRERYLVEENRKT